VSEEHKNVNFEGRRGRIDGKRGGKSAFIGEDGGNHVRTARVDSLERQRGIQVNCAVLRCYEGVSDLLRISHWGSWVFKDSKGVLGGGNGGKLP
jgi:hypothetical protein